jgi:hypothetical protein
MRSMVVGQRRAHRKDRNFRMGPLASAPPLHRLRRSPSPLRGEDYGSSDTTTARSPSSYR